MFNYVMKKLSIWTPVRFGLWVWRCLMLYVGDDGDDDDVGIADDDDDELNCSTCGRVYTPSNVCVCLQLCVFMCGHVPACVWHLGSTLLTSRPPNQRFLAFPSNMAIRGIDVNQLCNSSSLVV